VAVGNSIVTAYCTDENFVAQVGFNTCSVFGYLLWDGTSFASPLTAGAVALIKSARPNLDANDYRSLVVNTASPMVDPGGNTWPVQTAGAGSLNVVQGHPVHRHRESRHPQLR
jgi:subtilase family serine protease